MPTPCRRPPTRPLNNCQHMSRARLVQDHTSLDSLLLFIGALYPFCTCHVYIPPRPALARYENTVVLSPALLLCVRHLSPLVHVRYELATVPLEPRGPNTDCIATFRPLLHLHAHTHTLSLSLFSLSQRQWDNNHTHTPLSSPARVLTSGRRSA